MLLHWPTPRPIQDIRRLMVWMDIWRGSAMRECDERCRASDRAMGDYISPLDCPWEMFSEEELQAIADGYLGIADNISGHRLQLPAPWGPSEQTSSR
ncbi:hypothetical protein N9L68_05945 [bacterium]|nr:hypothetical protein [bacterium]